MTNVISCKPLEPRPGHRCSRRCPSRHKAHDDVIKWKHFPRYWPFVRGIHRSPVNSPHKGQWQGALIFTSICVRINGWVNNRDAGDLRRHRAHYDAIVMNYDINKIWQSSNCFQRFLPTFWQRYDLIQNDQGDLFRTLGSWHLEGVESTCPLSRLDGARLFQSSE